MNLSLECWLIELDEPGGKVKSDPDFETIRSIMLHEIKRLQKHTMIDSSMIAIRDIYQYYPEKNTNRLIHSAWEGQKAEKKGKIL